MLIGKLVVSLHMYRSLLKFCLIYLNTFISSGSAVKLLIEGGCCEMVFANQKLAPMKVCSIYFSETDVVEIVFCFLV